MRDAFPDIDLDNLPEGFANFIRVSEPDIEYGEYEIPYLSHYDWNGNVVKDVWLKKPMTQEQINAIEAQKHLLQQQRDDAALTSTDLSGSVPNVA